MNTPKPMLRWVGGCRCCALNNPAPMHPAVSSLPLLRTYYIPRANVTSCCQQPAAATR